MASDLLVATLAALFVLLAYAVWWAAHDMDYCRVEGVGAVAPHKGTPVLELAPAHRGAHPHRWLRRTIVGRAAALGGAFEARVARVEKVGNRYLVTLDRPFPLQTPDGSDPVVAGPVTSYGAIDGDGAYVAFQGFLPWL